MRCIRQRLRVAGERNNVSRTTERPKPEAFDPADGTAFAVYVEDVNRHDY
jgi:hypothetical protein